MENPKYTKADLIWEATRRNEDYKKDYKEVYDKYIVTNHMDNIASLKRIPDEKPNKWKIRMDGGLGFETYYWLDPTTTLENIYAEIKETGNSRLHPYYRLFRSPVKINDSFYHGQAWIETHNVAYLENHEKENNDVKATSGFFRLEIEISDEKSLNLICVDERDIEDQVLLTIHPLNTDEEIKNHVKKIKNKALRSIAAKIEGLKKNGVETRYPPDINDYIGWLQHYDIIIDFYIKNNNGVEFVIKKGAIVLPEKFDYEPLIPLDIPRQDVSYQMQKFKEDYEDAVLIIQSTPDLVFSLARPPKN